jgi:hypothetical protein
MALNRTGLRRGLHTNPLPRKQTSNVSSTVQTATCQNPIMGFTRNLDNDLRTRHKRSKQVSCEIGTAMLWTILAVLVILWLLGVATSYTLGGFIHILLLVALAIFVIGLIQGRRRSA